MLNGILLNLLTKVLEGFSMHITSYLKRISSASLAALLLASASMAGISGTALAAVSNPTPTAKVSFTFDDGLLSAYSQAAPTLSKYGLTGTDYVITGCVGMQTVPNTCHANTDMQYMTWTQIKALQSTYKWEIGSHTATHPYLATKDATDGQPNVLTPTQVASELANSKSALAAQGITATDFSTPYGDYNNATLAAIAKVYASHRGFADEGNNSWPNNDYLLYDMRVQAGVTVAQVESRIDQAIANNQWLILTMHNIKTTASTNPDDYEYPTAYLDQIAAYVKAKQTAGLIKSVNVNQGLVSGLATDNLMPNSSFDSGITGGWTTSNATAVTVDSANNGSYPSATKSIKFAPSSTASRLFSPLVSVNPSTTYLYKNFVNVTARTTGDVEFYIDEYDANGNWISGQYKKAEASAFVENLNFTYKPTSITVAKASLQITNTASSGITAYLDNVQMFALTTAPAPTPASTETFDSGIANGWKADNTTALTADNTSHGSPNNVVNSVKFTAGTTDAHLFGPVTAVTPTQTYNITSYLNLQTLSSNEVAFYIDEYDANGNWVSGQYKFGARTIGARDVTFAYKPSSASVAKASYQFILPANSGATGYLDDIRIFLAQ
jgi:peptidoglycan/xylan/chitin deacetylase (PgdA/CDA1 family)